MSADAGGYPRLHRSLAFISQELGEANQPKAVTRIEAAMAFFGGCPSECLGESLRALEALLGPQNSLNPSLEAFVSSLAAEIREGFERVGGA